MQAADQTDLRPGGFFPGNYYCTCVECGSTVQDADKRSIRCPSCARMVMRITELEAALREDHDTMAHMRNAYPFTAGDPLADWDEIIRKRVAAIRDLVK